MNMNKECNNQNSHYCTEYDNYQNTFYSKLCMFFITKIKYKSKY